MKNGWVKSVLMFGIISLLGDLVYEGARSVVGPYLKTLGASAFELGLIVGISEMLGYAFRLPSGYIADRYRTYIHLTIIGYLLIAAIPLMGVFKSLTAVFILLTLERIGKGIRGPARDSIVSFLTERSGRGIGFGILEALDQIGALLGPMMFSVMLLIGFDYSLCFLIMIVPLILLLSLLLKACWDLRDLDVEVRKGVELGLEPLTLFLFLTTLGVVNFQLISYHYKAVGYGDYLIPLTYSIAMLSDAVLAPVLGKLYETFGVKSLAVLPISAMLIPLSFKIPEAVVFYGISMCAYETVVKSAVADLSSSRGTAYGLTSMAYGLSAFISSALMGYLYEIDPVLISISAIAFECLALLYLCRAVAAKSSSL